MQTAEKFIIRLPNGMRDRIRAFAVANHRTMNAEVVHRLDRAYAAEEENGAVGTAIPPRPDQSVTHSQAGEK